MEFQLAEVVQVIGGDLAITIDGEGVLGIVSLLERLGKDRRAILAGAQGMVYFPPHTWTLFGLQTRLLIY